MLAVFKHGDFRKHKYTTHLLHTYNYLKELYYENCYRYKRHKDGFLMCFHLIPVSLEKLRDAVTWLPMNNY